MVLFFFLICNFSPLSFSHTSPVFTNGEKRLENKAERSRFRTHRHFALRHFLLSSHLLICGDDYLLDVFHIISRIEAHLSILEPAFAPTLIIFFANFSELVAWRKKKERMNIFFIEDKGLV